MKKFTLKHIIMAFIVGALVMISGQALADTVSQIGNKVDSEATVYVNGERVSDAIIIKGKSYTPSRDVAEALGGIVEWKGSDNSIMITNENTIDWEKLQQESKLKASISGAQRNIEMYEGLINKYDEEYLSKTSEPLRSHFASEVEKYTDQLETEKANLEKYEKELQELESAK